MTVSAATPVSNKPRYKVQRSDKLPKSIPVDQWLDLHRKRDMAPRIGGVAWMFPDLHLILRLDGRVHALNFKQFTATSPVRARLPAAEQAIYDRYLADFLAGKFNAFLSEKQREHDAGVGF